MKMEIARYDSTKPFMVWMLEFTNIDDAVEAAVSASMLKENAFTAQICQTVRKGVYGYAGTSVAFACFRNGVDLDELSADEDGVPDLDRRAHAFRSRG